MRALCGISPGSVSSFTSQGVATIAKAAPTSGGVSRGTRSAAPIAALAVHAGIWHHPGVKRDSAVSVDGVRYPVPHTLADEIMPKTLTTATVDRLLHHAHVVVTQGDSFRLAQATCGQGVKPLR